MKELKIGNKTAKLPIIQGGMGVGVSRSGLAGAVASEGAVGIISTAQIGYDETGVEQNYKECNKRAIEMHVKRALKQAKDGLVGVNVMVALKDYAQHVKTAVKAGADVIISGAGLPIDLPGLVEGSDTKIAPIVSSEKAAHIILKMWGRKYERTADFVVVEGPKAGGHLGFSREELECRDHLNYDLEIKKIIQTVREFGRKFGQKIPVIVAGGVFSREDVSHVLQLGADGVQVASKFVATEECDANLAYKEAYIRAKSSDVDIIESPVGMPGRALKNRFLEQVKKHPISIGKCYGCLAKCNPATIPYCITDALIRAVKGDVEDGLVFCGADVGRIEKMSTVREVVRELVV